MRTDPEMPWVAAAGRGPIPPTEGRLAHVPGLLLPQSSRFRKSRMAPKAEVNGSYLAKRAAPVWLGGVGGRNAFDEPFDAN
jgi:hypothetical protein